MSVYTIICSLIGRSDSLGREGVQVYVLFLPYMYLLMNLYLAPDKLPLTRTPHIHTPSVIITSRERKGEECFLHLLFRVFVFDKAMYILQFYILLLDYYTIYTQ